MNNMLICDVCSNAVFLNFCVIITSLRSLKHFFLLTHEIKY